MFFPSSSALTINCFYILMLLFFKSSCAYVVDSNELTDSFNNQEYGLNYPFDYDRSVRTTTFPRIGRSSLDSEETSSSLADVNTSSSSEENNNNENELRWMEQRSILFPRIGRRAFHNLLLANSRSNPHRMLDSQGRHYLIGYDYNIHHTRPQSKSHYRGKRNNPM